MPHLQQFLIELRAEAAQARSTPIPPLPFSLFHLFESTGDRGEYERPYFDRRRRLLALTLETAVNKTDVNLPALHDLIWELCNEYTWVLPAHLPVGVTAVQAYRLPPEQIIDLFSAHTAHALAETLVLLGNQLAPWLHYRVRTEIERRIFRLLFYDPHHFKWEYEPINNDAFVNYSDAAERVAIHAGLGSYLSARFQQPIPALAHPSFHTDHIYRWGNVVRDLLCTDETFLHTAVTDGSFYLPHTAWMVDRRISDGKTIAFSAKGGHNDEPHNHNDLGHFILHLGGESLLADLGAGVYMRHYFTV